ncbi:MAG: molecular chaperone DnaJ [Elusimicrobiota bacterium]
MAQKRDYYEILGVSKSANPDELKAAYRKLALQHHPDRNPGNKQAEEKFKELNEAYSVVSDPEKRKVYDQFGHAGVQGGAGGAGQGFEGGFSGFGDIFGDIFEQAFGGGQSRQRSGGQPGRDLRVDKIVSLNEVLTGVDSTIDINRAQSCETCSGSGAKPGTNLKKCSQCGGRGQVRVSQGFFTMAQTCSRCRGTGEIIENPCHTCSGSGRVHKKASVKVRIPPGVENGTTLRVNGSGEAGERGAPAGDLYVVVGVKEDKKFERDGSNLFTDASISFPMAALGGEIEVSSLEGKITLKIPAGTQPGTHFRMSEHGLPSLRSRSRGDLYVRVQVVVPKKLSKEEKKIVQDLGAKWDEGKINKDESVLKRVFGS